MEPTEIFVNVATGNPDAPYQRINLQQMADAFFGVVWDLKTEIGDLRTELAELKQWGALTDELATAVRKMQTTFDTLAKQLHGTTVTAKALMQGRTPSKDVH